MRLEDQLPLPSPMRSPYTVNYASETDTGYNKYIVCGTTPLADGNQFSILRRVWMVFGSNDSGASETKNSEVVFYTGTLSNRTKLLSIKTNAGGGAYSAGDLLTKGINFVLPRGKLLFVMIVPNGATANMTGKAFACGFDITTEQK